MRSRFHIDASFNCYIVNANNHEAYVGYDRSGILFNAVEPQVLYNNKVNN